MHNQPDMVWSTLGTNQSNFFSSKYLSSNVSRSYIIFPLIPTHFSYSHFNTQLPKDHFCFQISGRERTEKRHFKSTKVFTFIVATRTWISITFLGLKSLDSHLLCSAIIPKILAHSFLYPILPYGSYHPWSSA